MRRALIAVVALVLLALLPLALSLWGGSNREGELAFSPESVDLGQVPLDRIAPARFEMRNTGGKTVKITKAQIRVVEGC